MNYITLKFRDQSLENQYQELKTSKIRKPLYYGLYTFCFFLNVFKIIEELIKNNYTTPFINYIFLAFMLFSLALRIKNQKNIKQLLVASNIVSGLLQLNFTDPTTEKQEYYSFGSSFSQLQAVSYFVSDFTDGIVQVFAHLVMKVAITSYYTHKIDILCTGFAVTGSIFILVTIYICDRSSRKSYLQTIGEDIWDQQLPYLINKPFLKIEYSNTIIKILQSNLLQLIPGYQQENCEGCNGRQFLRECLIKNQSLSNCIQNKQDILNQSMNANLKCNRINIRLCKCGYEENHFVIIVDKIITKTTNKQIPLLVRKSLNKQIKITPSDHIKFYNWGLLSLFLLNNREVKEVNLLDTIKKLNKSYNNYLLPIQIFTKSNQVVFPTYANLLRIFLIQIYHILIELHQKSYRTRVQLKDTDDHVEFHILIMDSRLFHRHYRSNIFIQNVQRLILYNPITKDLRLYLSKQLPFQ